MTALQLIHEAIERQRLLMHDRTHAVARVDKHAVVIPLDVGDLVLGEQRIHLAEQIRVRLWVRNVEHMLVAPRRGRASVDMHEPVRMRAEEIGVGVDHLRLEPQPELHAQRAHAINEWSQPLRPHGRIHPPVTEPGSIIATQVEPAVVEHKPLHTDPRRALCQRCQAREVVIEVDGLPHVERHWTRTCRVLGTRTHMRVEALTHAINTDTAVHRKHIRCGIGSTRR